APAGLDGAARELEEYFAGRRRRFGLPLDLQLSEGLRRRGVQQLPQIEDGANVNDTEIARRAGSGRAARAAGSAGARNPLAVVVPCQRVVRSDGALGRYVGGLAATRPVLELEAACAGWSGWSPSLWPWPVPGSLASRSRAPRAAPHAPAQGPRSAG